MKVLTLCAVAALGVGLASMSIEAHHSTNAVYDESKTIEVQGKVLEWVMVNPHPYLVVEITNPQGRTEQWDLSFGGSAVIHLTQQGYTRDTFKIGETVIARGSPTRVQPVKGILIRGNLTRPDGSRIPPAPAGGARGAAGGRGAAAPAAPAAPAGQR